MAFVGIEPGSSRSCCINLYTHTEWCVQKDLCNSRASGARPLLLPASHLLRAESGGYGNGQRFRWRPASFRGDSRSLAASGALTARLCGGGDLPRNLAVLGGRVDQPHELERPDRSRKPWRHWRERI